MTNQVRKRNSKSEGKRIDALQAQGFTHHQRGQLKHAEACFRRALTEAPNDPNTPRLLAEVLIDLGQHESAITLLLRLLTQHPNMASAHYTLGNAYRLSGRTDDAILSYQAALSLRENFDAALHGLGLALRNAERENEALECFRLAIRTRPDWAVAWKDLGLTFAILGNLPLAEAALQRAVTLHPGLGDAQRHLAALRHDVADNAELTKLAALCEETIYTGERIELLFALGRQFHKAGAYADAFQNFSRANALRRAEQAKLGLGFDRGKLQETVDTLISAFSSAFFASHKDLGDPSVTPVFIVGMPRAGSSLFEQIAASHSKVFGAGERNDIGMVAQTIGALPNPGWTEKTIAAAADIYRQRMRSDKPTALRVIDKTPDNILLLVLSRPCFHARA